MKYENGNILFLILVAVALFAALSYAVTGTSRTTGNTIESEKAKLTQGEIDSYAAAMNTGINRLKLINNCSIIDYTPPTEQGGGDKSCHLFHPDGGAVSYRDLALGLGCPLTDLAVGEACNGVVYAGLSSGYRLYTTQNDLGTFTWNNGVAGPPWTVCTTGRIADGLANTNDLLSCNVVNIETQAPYKAAQACRALGEEWYLPAETEVKTFYQNKALIGGFNSTGVAPLGHYWTSYRLDSFNIRSINMANNANLVTIKTTNLNVRCARRD